jgi:hypothetical protein
MWNPFRKIVYGSLHENVAEEARIAAETVEDRKVDHERAELNLALARARLEVLNDWLRTRPGG